MLKFIVKKQLEPELNELKNEFKKRDLNEILIEYPNIKHIIENLDLIEQEVLEWIKLATT